MAATLLLILRALPICHALVIEQITWPFPSSEARSSRDPVISMDGNVIAFSSESDFGNTGLAEFADGVNNIWSKEAGHIQHGQNGPVTQVSRAEKPSDKDTYRPTVNHDGSIKCFESNEINKKNNIQCAIDGTIKEVTNSDTNKAMYPDISSDGSTLVFQSFIELVPEVTVGKNKYQIYLTKDAGDTFTMVTPGSIAGTSVSGYPAVSSNGDYVAFRSKMSWPDGAVVSTKEEAWLAHTADLSDVKLTKISNLAGKECDTSAIYDALVKLHGESNLTDAGVTKVTSSSCPYAAVKGMIKGGGGTIGVGAMQPEISGDGRFVTYTTNFAAADAFGSHDTANPVASSHLFLYDRVLGMTWQITKPGAYESGFSGDAPKSVEDFCCPGASSSKKRGSCSTANELKGLCCWQKPCGFPALNSDISEDGRSIVFVSDIDYLGTGDAVNKDLEIWHYYIPTSTLLRITKTTNDDLDDVSPKISGKGDKVVWTSDANFSGTDDYMHANQIWVASLTFGCSGNTEATNYVANPDVEECCEWPEVMLASLADQVSKASVDIMFEGDVSMMLHRANSSSGGMDAFCEQFVQSAHEDLACALGVPPNLLKVTAPATRYAGTRGRYDRTSCGDWLSGHSFQMSVDFLPISPTGAMTGIPDPQALANHLKAQHEDASSKLWKGYVTKMLKVDSVPSVSMVSPRPIPDTLSHESAGSCYDMQTHVVTCNVGSEGCEYYYDPGYVSGTNGCCHCQASCDFSKETHVYGDQCEYYAEMTTTTTTTTLETSTSTTTLETSTSTTTTLTTTTTTTIKAAEPDNISGGDAIVSISFLPLMVASLLLQRSVH